MTTEREYQNLYDRIATLRETVVDRLAADLVENPQLAEILTGQIDELLTSVEQSEMQKAPPPDKGLAELIGVGDNAADELGDTRVSFGLSPYDETVTSERIIAVGDLYYIYQHEKIGIFRTMLKLQELFKAGTVRLSSGKGAFGLYQYDRRQVLRHTGRDRMQAYRRVFGYTRSTPPAGAQPNRDFQNLYIHFMTQVAHYFRDKRISEVIRPQSDRYSFGSVAVVRRAGLDLRNNLKGASYGHVNVLRVEVLQLLDEAFRILGEPDVRKLFGADNAWDVVEDVAKRYFNQPAINISQRSRMAIAGRNVLRWLAQPHLLNASRPEFEALLNDIADEAEEWLTSAEALGMMRPQPVALVRNGTGHREAREFEWG
ncbi:MAG: hypothetical protein R2867_22980 [Caldilineaceae bacterium]